MCMHGTHTHRICSLSEAAAEMALWCPLHWKNYLTVTIARSNEITEMDSSLCDLRSKVENIFLSLSWSFRWTLFVSMCAFIRLSDWFDPVCHLIYSGFALGDNQGITRNYFTMTHTYHILLWKKEQYRHLFSFSAFQIVYILSVPIALWNKPFLKQPCPRLWQCISVACCLSQSRSKKRVNHFI